MKVESLLGELENSKAYTKFLKENSNSFFAAAFLILDLKDKTEKTQLDFFLKEENKLASFEFPINSLSEAKIHDDKIKEMKEQTTNIKIDIEDLEKICKEIIKKNESRLIPTKIISILKDDEWNLTCMDDALGIVRIKINAITGEEKMFDKGSLMDFMGIKKIKKKD